ncbi:MAG: T9SS type A sorting domain-containing protein [Bacteroidota bacterium]
MRALLIVCLLALSLPLRAQDAPDALVERFFTNKSVYEYGEPITVIAQYYNASDEAIGFRLTPCSGIKEVDGADVEWACTLLELEIEVFPREGVETTYEIDPDLQGFPWTEGDTHTISIDGFFTRETLTISAPQYLGGLVSVWVNDNADPAEVEAIRADLNVTDIEVNGGTYWLIEGMTPEEAVEQYRDSELFGAMNTYRPYPRQREATLREVDADILLAMGTDGRRFFPEDTISISLALTNLRSGSLSLGWPDGFQAGYDLGTVIGSCTCSWITMPTALEIASGGRYEWSDPDIAGPCFDYIPAQCGVLDGSYTVRGYVNGYFSPIELPIFVAPPVANEPETTPAAAMLTAAPNPFSAQTTLSLTIPAAQRIEAIAYDVLGRRVAVLHEGTLAAGTHPLTFEAARLPAGVYVVRVLGDDLALTRRVTLAR